jgi:opacity protein-like surface antigen
MKKAAILIAALAGLLLAAQAQAQAPGQGFYLGGGIGTVWSDGGSIFSTTVNEDASPGGKIYFGYMQDENWGMEIGIHSLGKYESQLAGVPSDEFKTAAVSISGVYTKPLFDTGYNVNVRLGLAFTQAEYRCLSACTSLLPDTKKRGVSGTIGLGIGAKLTQALSMRVDFDHFGSVKHAVGTTEYNESYDVLSANLQLLF